jgi:quinohemoprotein ethanol dehydrogenase
VSIEVGYGGTSNVLSNLALPGWKFNLQPRRLLTFALGATASLPPTPAPDTSLHPVDDPQLIIDERQAQAGMALYGKACVGCHGANLISTGSPAPDLRESPIALRWESFDTVLKTGALAPRGMPQYDDLSQDERRSLFMYVRDGARKAAR